MEHQQGKVKRERENASAGDQDIQMPEGIVHGNQLLSNSNDVGDGADSNASKRMRFEVPGADSDSDYDDRNDAYHDGLRRGFKDESHSKGHEHRNLDDRNTHAEANSDNHTRFGDGEQEEKDGEGKRPRREAKEKGEESRRNMLRAEPCGAEDQDEELDVSHRRVDSTVETPGIIVAENAEDLARKVWAFRPDAESVDAKFVHRNSRWSFRIVDEPGRDIRLKHPNARFMENLKTLADGTQDIEQAWNKALLERKNGFRVEVHRTKATEKEDEIRFTMFFPTEAPSRASIPATPIDTSVDDCEGHAGCAISPVSSTSTSVEPTASHASLSPSAKGGPENQEKMRQGDFIDSLMEMCQNSKKWIDQEEEHENLKNKCELFESRCKELEGEIKSLKKELEEKDTKLKIIQNASR
ncbi:Hypothetical Protein FCC1311_108212 [Hondaea fermentalgiana]|uniref:Uncharacterized protein n=1 Tax=Hondaea fermentalgiana TaxID=2315210 RepID=A0A2R5GUR8_9STRA|nr:Hypothetical Protein FCC1311_108212 [Hondaea fermentalgiana]|eukprot:GBG34600.1 Hypothetical Protein FCC1311_108212 [Hondaea fermentalgiana]